jgi:hypothetical protein
LTLDEIFEKYSENNLIRRPNRTSCSISWLKMIIPWVNDPSIRHGFIPPWGIRDDIKANDWEKVND